MIFTITTYNDQGQITTYICHECIGKFLKARQWLNQEEQVAVTKVNYKHITCEWCHQNHS
jgi:hypothetical protein